MHSCVQVAAAVYSNGGTTSDYLKDLSGDVKNVKLPSAPLVLVPTAPTSVELLKSAHIIVANQLTSHFVPHADTKQARACCFCKK